MYLHLHLHFKLFKAFLSYFYDQNCVELPYETMENFIS